LNVITLTRHECGANLALLSGMHRLRRKVFKDRLDWDVSVTGDFEIDSFDTVDPTYLLAVTRRQAVVGCVRLLPTTGPNMLADTFPMLLDGRPAPRSATIIESSRFCVDTENSARLADNGLRRATFMLFAGMIEWARFVGAEAIATVTDVRMERVLRRAGWPLQRLGPPRKVGNTMALAGLLDASPTALSAMKRAGELDGSVLAAPASVPLAA
jgi:acyl homoserine lactone synthase